MTWLLLVSVFIFVFIVVVVVVVVVIFVVGSLIQISRVVVEERNDTTENMGQYPKEEKRKKVTYADIVRRQVSGNQEEKPEQRGMSK